MTLEQIWCWLGQGSDQFILMTKTIKNNILFTAKNQGAFIPIAFFYFPYSNVFFISPFI
jgi:hypothetical protein